MAVAYQNVKESRHDRKFQKEELYNNWENVNIVSLNTDWIKFMDNHKLHLGIDGTLSFLKSTANTENVLTGETSYNTTRYPDGSNSMHTIEAFATHVWNISPKWSMHDGVRLAMPPLIRACSTLTSSHSSAATVSARTTLHTVQR